MEAEKERRGKRRRRSATRRARRKKRLGEGSPALRGFFFLLLLRPASFDARQIRVARPGKGREGCRGRLSSGKPPYRCPFPGKLPSLRANLRPVLRRSWWGAPVLLLYLKNSRVKLAEAAPPSSVVEGMLGVGAVAWSGKPQKAYPQE